MPASSKTSKLVSLQKLKNADLVVEEMPDMADMAPRMPSINSMADTEQLGWDYSEPVPQTPAESQEPGASSQISAVASASQKAHSRSHVSSFTQRDVDSCERVMVRFY
jgi:hypothetical protein